MDRFEKNFDQEKEEEKAADGKIAGIWRASYS